MRSLSWLARVAVTTLAIFFAPISQAQDPDYQLLVDQKMAQIKWKEADLKAAERELAILNQFLGNFESKSADLDTTRQQLIAADTKLASIQEGNLVKLTLRMGLETYNTVSDTINLGKSVATSLVTHGLNSAIGSAALDKLTNGLTNEGRAALGMDAETLGSPRAVKIKAVSDAARATYPELGRVQQMLGMSLEGIKAAAYHEDGTVLGDTGAILRKNIMVRDEISAALVKLDVLATEASSAKTDADADLPAAQAEVTRLSAELATLKSELSDLTSDWKQSERTARFAANEAAIVPPADLPVANPPPREEGETDDAYQARAAAAVAAAAWERWNNESPALLASIAACKGRMTTAVGEIQTAMETYGLDPVSGNTSAFIVSHAHYEWADSSIDAETTATYDGTISAYYRIQDEIGIVTPAVSALPETLAKVETLSDDYTTLENLRNELEALAQLLAESGAGSPPETYSVAMGSTPGSGQQEADTLASGLIQMNAALPVAMANAEEKRDLLLAATSAWSSGISVVQADLDAELAAAESALNALIAQGYAWNTALASSPGLAHDFARADLLENRLGYFNGETFVSVVRWSFDMDLYQTQLQAALSEPGTDALANAQGLRNRYQTLVSITPPIKDAYDAAWHRFTAAYKNLEAYAAGQDFPVLGDIMQAGSHASESTPVDTSGVTDQAQRFASLYQTMFMTHETSSAGGEPIFGEPVLVWHGLQILRQIPDPGLDDPDSYLPHRMLAQKTIIHDDGPSWLSLDPDAFDVRYSAVYNDLLDIMSDAEAAFDWNAKDVTIALMSELGGVYDDYRAAHPPAVITRQPLGDSTPIDPGNPVSAMLSVEATGDFLTYQWYASDSLFGSWSLIDGATSSSYTTPPILTTSYFRVAITNPGGTTISEIAQIGEAVSGPEFTSADNASAQVGIPFRWTFTAAPAGCMIWLNSPPPAGLSFDFLTNTLSGVPFDEGTCDLAVTAFHIGSSATQTFHLTIEAGELPPFESWLKSGTTPEQRMDPEFTSANGQPAGDGVPNLLKYAFNMVGPGPGQAPSLDMPCNTPLAATGSAGLPAVATNTHGQLVLEYVRRKPSIQSDVTYTVEFTDSLEAGSWSPLLGNTGVTEVVTPIDETWERAQVIDSGTPASGSRFVRVRVSK